MRMIAGALALAGLLSGTAAAAIDQTCATCGRRTLDSLNTIINPVRVNQVGYRSDDPHKRAIFGGVGYNKFKIVDSKGDSVFGGKLSNQGSFPYKGRILIKGYYNSITQLYQFSNTNDTDTASTTSAENVWFADFGALTDSGTYRVVVGPDTSLPFDIRTTIYNDVFETELKYFGMERSGDNDSWMHGASHMKDGSGRPGGDAVAGSLSGGWYDCGDYFKVGQTDAYAFTNLILTYTLWPQKAEDRYGSSYNDTLPFGNDGIPDLLREAKIGADYVMKLYRASLADGLVAKHNMWIEVGVWTNDHQYWDKPENADIAPLAKGGPPRPVDSSQGSAVPAQYAGSLALFAKAWKPFNPTYADSCLQAAKDIYKSIVVPNFKRSGYAPTQFYTKQGRWDDDLAWSAAGLWYATADTSYKHTLMNDSTYAYNSGYIYNNETFKAGILAVDPDINGSHLFSPGGWVIDYQNTFIQPIWLLWSKFYKSDTLAAKWGISSTEASDMRLRIRTVVGTRYASESTNGTVYAGTKAHVLKPYDLVWSSVTWGMNRYNMGGLLPLVAYHEMIRDDSATSALNYWNIILDNMNYNLGANPWDISFVMGAGSKNLQHPHNRISNPEGYNAGGIPYVYRSPKGALMGGAVPGTLLRDEWEKYDVTETCIDFAAQMVIPAQYLARDLPPDTTGPVYSNVTVVRVTDSTALISWQTDELSQDTLYYSLVKDGTVIGTYGVALSKNKTVTITGLSAGTTYYFWIKGIDIYNNASTDDNRGRDYSFTTTTTSSAAPAISDVKACNIRSNKATVFWWTNIAATSEVDYYPQDTPTTVRSVKVDDEGLPGRFHKVTLTGLTPNTWYRYKVVSDGTTADSGGLWFRFKTTVDYANYTIQIKPTSKNSSGAGVHFYVEVANNESKAYTGLELRFYFQAPDSIAKKIVVHHSDDAIFDVTGTMSASGSAIDTIGSAVAVAGMSGYWYIPITIKATLPVAGRARLELKFDDSNWSPIPWSAVTGAWSLEAHASPVAFAGVDLTHLWAGPDEVETYNGAATLTYTEDPYIAAYYQGEHIFGYPPDGTKPNVFRTSYFTFTKPLPSPAVAVTQDSLQAHFQGRTWSLPDVVRADWQTNGPFLRPKSLLASRWDSIQFTHDTTDVQGTNSHEFAFWGDRDSAYCSCAWQRWTVIADTMQRALVLQWAPSDSTDALINQRKQLTISLLDSTGAVLDTTGLSIALSTSSSHVHIWSSATSTSPVASVTLTQGIAQVWVSDSLADTVELYAAGSVPKAVVFPDSVKVRFSSILWPSLVSGAVVAGCGTSEVHGVLNRALVTTVVTGAEILSTAGFETPVVTYEGQYYNYSGQLGGWTVSNVDLTSGLLSTLTAAEGTQSLDLNAKSAGSIGQAVVTSSGTRLRFSLEYSANNATGSTSPDLKQAAILWDGVAVDTLSINTSNGSVAWTAKSIDLVSTGHDSLVLQALTSGNAGIMVDALSLKALSGTSSTTDSILGGRVVLTGSNGDSIVAQNLGPSRIAVDASGQDVSVDLGAALPDGIVGGRLDLEIRAYGKVVSTSIALVDSAGPWLDSAKIVQNLSGASQDTVYFWTSEAVKRNGWPLVVRRSGATIASSSFASYAISVVDSSSHEYMLLATAGSLKAGDSLRLNPSTVTDVSGNPALDCQTEVPLASIMRTAQLVRAGLFRECSGEYTVKALLNKAFSGTSTYDTAVVVLRSGKDTVARDIVVKTSTSLGSDSATVTLILPAGLSGSSLEGTLDLKVTNDTGGWSHVVGSISDSVGPWVDSAKIVENLSGNANDSVYFWSSESYKSSSAWPFIVRRLGSTISGVFSTATLSVVDTTAHKYLIVLSAGKILANDSLRFDPSLVTDLHGNWAQDCGAEVLLGSISRPAPFSRSWILDSDADSRADKVVVKFKKTLASAKDAPDSVQVRFGASDSIRTVAVTSADYTDSTLTLSLSVPYGFGITAGSGTNGSGSVWLWKSGELLGPYTLSDSVGPALVSAAVRYGLSNDTLVLGFSEPVSARTAGAGWLTLQQGLAELALTGLDPTSTNSTVWSLPIAVGAASPGDSVRPLSTEKWQEARSGRLVVTGHPWIPVTGGERPPLYGWYLDSDGDGAVDHVALKFSRTPKTYPAITFLWTSASGSGFDSAHVDTTNWGVDASGTKAIIAIGPFSVGKTGSSTTDLGRWNSGGTLHFAIYDSVAPVLTSAALHYASQDSFPDTLHVRWSELIETPSWEALSNLVRYKHQGTESGMVVLGHAVDADGLGAQLLLSSATTQLRRGDSAAFPVSASDTLGNAVIDPTRWVPITFGARPVRVDFKFQTYEEYDESWPVRSGSSLQVWVRGRGDNQWLSATDSTPVPDTLHTVGVTISLNRILDGTVFIYDNAGTYVASMDLSPISALYAQGKLPTDASGMYQLKLTWDGRTKEGKLVSSGIYFMRLILKKSSLDDADGSSSVFNRVYKLGIKRVVK